MKHARRAWGRIAIDLDDVVKRMREESTTLGRLQFVWWPECWKEWRPVFRRFHGGLGTIYSWGFAWGPLEVRCWAKEAPGE